MDLGLLLFAIFGAAVGYILKLLINWLNIEDSSISQKNIALEFVCLVFWIWAYLNLTLIESITFGLISSILIAISWVDFKTFQIPLLFIVIGSIIAVSGIFTNQISLVDALGGIFIGSVMPLSLIGILYLITKRQGMGYGDIQLGIILGLWLGPVRMALTLFGASILSLIVWIFISIYKDFSWDLALPFGPYLAFSGIATFIGSVYFPSLFYHLIYY